MYMYIYVYVFILPHITIYYYINSPRVFPKKKIQDVPLVPRTEALQVAPQPIAGGVASHDGIDVVPFLAWF